MLRIENKCKYDKNRVCQGDIISNIPFIEYASEKDGQIEISKIIFPYVYVLTQECDLEQEYNSRIKQQGFQDKHLLSVIVAPLYNLAHFYTGDHLSELGLKMQSITSDPKKSDNKFLLQNRNPRYHYLEFPADNDIPNSIIDFKHYFTVNNAKLIEWKRKRFQCKVSELFREQISHRFAFFLSRIGLPEIS